MSYLLVRFGLDFWYRYPRSLDRSALPAVCKCERGQTPNLQASVRRFPDRVLAMGPKPAEFPHVKSFAYGRPRPRTVALKSRSSFCGELSSQSCYTQVLLQETRMCDDSRVWIILNADWPVGSVATGVIGDAGSCLGGGGGLEVFRFFHLTCQSNGGGIDADSHLHRSAGNSS